MKQRLRSFFARFKKRSASLDPARDWLVLLIASMLALSCIIIWNAWAFGTVANGGVIGTAATSTKPVFDQASLDAVHAIFANRAAEQGKYVTGAYRYADPSH